MRELVFGINVWELVCGSKCLGVGVWESVCGS